AVCKRGDRCEPLTASDILVVAPYNMQVRKLELVLDGMARVGTVDKFQGQEAPVVILSMCASSCDDAPRGLEFLLSPNRINVALTRAECVSIVVGSPALALSSCSSIEQVKLVNLYCKMLAQQRG
ncbi:MAG: AAA domain-containing protein, partial [Synechococcus sp.]